MEGSEIKGDKLRRAILIIWLANKFDEQLSISDLRRLCGYTGSGIYSAKEAGWFIEKEGKFIELSEKGQLYLEKNILVLYRTVKLLIIFSIFPLSLLLIQKLMYKNLNILLLFNEYSLCIAIILFIFMFIYLYRIMWFFEKRTLRTQE